MVEVETKTDRRHGVTFVNAIVTNTRTTAQRIRLESRLDGPTWPPRRGHASAPEWTDDAWESVVAPGQSLGVGFASPADPDPNDTPLELVSSERAPVDGPSETARGLIADLEEWAPPSAAVSRPRARSQSATRTRSPE